MRIIPFSSRQLSDLLDEIGAPGRAGTKMPEVTGAPNQFKPFAGLT
jgi:hypothetical protein